MDILETFIAVDAVYTLRRQLTQRYRRHTMLMASME
jgi:hypothetical protein